MQNVEQNVSIESGCLVVGNLLSSKLSLKMHHIICKKSIVSSIVS